MLPAGRLLRARDSGRVVSSVARAGGGPTLASHWTRAPSGDCDWSTAARPRTLHTLLSRVSSPPASSSVATSPWPLRGGTLLSSPHLLVGVARPGPSSCVAAAGVQPCLGCPAQSLHTIQPKTSCTAQLRPINLYSLSPQLKCTHRENFIYRLFQGPFNPLISEIYTRLECFRNGGRNMRWRSEVSTGGHQ